MLSLLLAAASAPAAAAVSVETANGDWSKLPQLSQRGYEHLSEKMQAKLYEIAAAKQCPSFVLKYDRLDMRVSFAVQYAPDGTLTRIVMPKLDCPEAESVLGGTLLEMVQAGDYAPTGKSLNGWYQGGLGFSFTGKNADAPAVVPPNNPNVAKTATAQDPNEILCQSVPIIGSRLQSKRVCMSRAKWIEQQRADRDEVDKVQKRRVLLSN
jgi:hypothetical protein